MNSLKPSALYLTLGLAVLSVTPLVQPVAQMAGRHMSMRTE